MYSELIGQLLLREARLTQEQLDVALRIYQEQKPGKSIGQILLEQEFVSAEELASALAMQWDLPYVPELSDSHLDAKRVHGIPLAFLKSQQILPITYEGKSMIALADPLNLEAYDAIMNILGEFAERVICTEEEIERTISRCYYHDESAEEQGDSEAIENISEDFLSQAQPEDLLNIANQAPIVKMVNQIFFKAVHSRASDIHIEPYEDQVKVRYRIDGILHDMPNPPRQHLAALISRIKIMANLDIAERRLPQDGQSRIRIGQQEMDIRCSVIPTTGGERVVLRLLDKGGHELGLAHAGFSPKVLEQFQQVIHRPNGIILITGPTGSGKTTTLYSVLTELNNQERNILTVEDPIEYQLPGVGQMQVKPKIGLTFANCLRHILRQDPDIIMLGEIRDEETARIAVQSSLTGHLVLSTLHTNDAASAVSRMLDMEIEPYLLASSIAAIMAQRLVRLICSDCKTPVHVEKQVHRLWLKNVSAGEFTGQFYEGVGCSRCLDTGYYGRTGIFEFLPIDEDFKELIHNRVASHTIKEAAINKGMITLKEDGLCKAGSGETTLTEIIRVTQDHHSENAIPQTDKQVLT